MKNLLITLITLSGINPLFSQKDTSQFYNKTLSSNNFSIELFGKAGFYSLGYERTFYKSKKLLLAAGINVSYEPFAGVDGVVAPIGISALIGEKENKLLLGLAETNAFDFYPYPKTQKERNEFNDSLQDYRPLYSLMSIVPSVGWRRYLKKGNSITVAFSPIIFTYRDGGYKFNALKMLPWVGINYNIKF